MLNISSHLLSSSLSLRPVTESPYSRKRWDKYDFLNSLMPTKWGDVWKSGIVQSGQGGFSECDCVCRSGAKGREDHLGRMTDVRRPSNTRASAHTHTNTDTVLVCPISASGVYSLSLYNSHMTCGQDRSMELDVLTKVSTILAKK